MTDPGRSGGEGTGWHIHYASSRLVHRDGGGFCSSGTPVLVIPAADARDTIARALGEAEDDWDDLIEHGYAYSQGRTREDFFAEQILAALVGEAGR